MPDHRIQSQPPARPPDRKSSGDGRYQHHDLKGWWIATFVGALMAFAAGAHWGLWELMWVYASHQRPGDQPQSAVTNTIASQPGPPLQPSMPHDRLPAEDLEAMHAQEDLVFAALGWGIDPATHRVKVPDAVVRRVQQRTPTTQTARGVP